MVHASSLADATRPTGHRAWQIWLGRVLAMAVAHALLDYLLGILARQATVSSGLAIGSGISLACMLRWGWNLWPGAFLSQVIGLYAASIHEGPLSIAGALGFGASESIQNLLAWYLLHRWVRQPTELNQPRDALALVVVTVLVAAPVGALCSIGTFFVAYGLDEASQLRGMWIDIWLVSSRAFLIGTPSTLALLSRPRDTRSARLLSIALPLLLATLLLFLAMSTVARWDKQRQSLDFERDAARAATALEKKLDEAQQTLAATRGLLVASPDIDAKAFDAGARAFLTDSSGVRFVAQALALPDQQPGDASLLLRLVSPAPALPDALPAAAPQWLDSLNETARTGQAVAAQASRTQEGRIQVALLQALEQPGRPASAALVAIDIASMLASSLRPGVLACLIDEDTRAGLRQLAGPAGCYSPHPLQSELRRRLGIGGRQWALRLYSASAPPFHNSPVAQLVGGLGLASMALLVVLLLTLSSRASRIESLVEQRTTELTHTLHALRRNEQRFRSVFDHAPVGVVIADLEGRPLDLNPALRTMLGYAAHESPEVDQLLGDATLPARFVGSGDAVIARQRALIKRDGSMLTVQQLTSLLLDEQHRPEHLLSVVHDISDQLKLVEHERARTVADAANRAKSEFLSRMSHELRTPLNGLLGFTQLLQLEREPLTPTQRSWIQRIGQAGWHLLAMINDVLDLSRVETGNLQVVLEPQDAHALARECLTLQTPAASKRGITIGLTLDPGARFVIADATRVREILNNLLSNAVKYNVDRGSLRLRVHATVPGAVDLSISDTGKGLTPAQVAALFQPFNRLGQERSGVEGTGIGLVITRRLAELMNGSIGVESRPGEGSTFTLRLPASETGPAVADAVEPIAAFGAPGPSGPRRLVYIEDNAVNIEVMRAVIGLRAELSLNVHEDGASGLAAILSDPPDLVMLDMNLPDIDGLTLLDRLRAAPQCAAVPVLIVSADAMDDHIAAGLQRGAAHYLTKPFAVADLMRRLDTLLPARERH